MQLTVVGVHGGVGLGTRAARRLVEVENSLDREFDNAQIHHLPTEGKSAKERARKRKGIDSGERRLSMYLKDFLWPG